MTGGILAVSTVSADGAGIRINELMSSNGGTIADEDGEYHDWIELHNSGTEAVNLLGYGLSDNAGNPFKWTFPDVALAPGGFLLVWASGKGEPEEARELADVPGLVLWLKADAEDYGEGAPVGLWSDQSGRGNHAFQNESARRPVFRTAAIHGLPAVEFNRSSAQWMHLPTSSFDGLPSLRNFTLITLGIWRGADISGIFGTPQSGGNIANTHFEIRAGGNLRLRVGGMNEIVAAGAVTPNRWSIFGAMMDSAIESPVARVFVDGQAVGVRAQDAGNVWLNQYPELRLGDSHSDRQLDGLIAEVLLFNRALPPEDRQVVERYLREKHGLSGSIESRAPHANFRIDAEGERLVLTAPDGTRIDDVAAVAVPRDVSFGRSAEAPDVWVYFFEPTPGGANTTAGYSAPLDPPVFSHQRGLHDVPFHLALETGHEGAAIYYTVDGSHPDENSGTLYAGPIPIGTTTVVRAMTFSAGALPLRQTDSHSYIFIEDVMRQPFRPAGFPGTWAPRNPSAPHYLMEPEVVNNPQYNERIRTGLAALPTLSLAMPVEDLFGAADGIYVNTQASGIDWERRTSVEWIDAGGAPGFQIDAGIRLQGGASRTPSNEIKHSFSLRFRSAYGAGSLDYPLFEGSPVARFDALHLRAVYNNSWTHHGGANNLNRTRADMIRDQWMRRALLDMGNIDAGRGTYVHLYLNGLYWGVYNLEERIAADHFARYHGGATEDYEAGLFSSGNDSSVSYDQLKAAVASRNWEAIGQALDIDSYIDHYLINSFGGNRDMSPANNWRAAGGGPAGALWRFYSWDAERTLELLFQDPLNAVPSPPGSGMSNQSGRTYDAPQFLTDLRAIPEFRLRFADRVHKHYFNGGALTPERNAARWMEYAAMLDDAIAAESARWGSYRRDVHCRTSPCLLYTRDDHWIAEIQRLLTEYFPARSGFVLDGYRAAGFYPSTDAPVFVPHGGVAGESAPVTLIAPSGGAIYYTIDGSDPRVAGALVYDGPIVLASGALIKARVLRAGEWSALAEAEFDVPPITAHALAAGLYRFDSWEALAAAGTYPAHMIFEQTGNANPGLGAAMDGYWSLPYNLTSRSRITGLEAGGLSFINTGNAQDVEGAGYLGSALLALDTRGTDQVRVQWVGGTVTPNERVYGLRLQYRIGASGPFADVPGARGAPVEYLANPVAGHWTRLGPVLLPPEMGNQQYAELRWKYYHVSGGSGPRAELRLDEILVRGGAARPASRLVFETQPVSGGVAGVLPRLEVRAIDEDSLTDTIFHDLVTLTLVGGGILEGTATASAVGGLAVFEGLSITGAGTFVIEASSGSLHPAQTEPFTIADAGPSFERWRQENFTGEDLLDPERSGPGADPLGTGVPNLFRYAFGIGLEESADAFAPRLVEVGEELRFRFFAAPEKADLAWVVFTSTNLTQWDVWFDSRGQDVPMVENGWADLPVALDDEGGGLAEERFFRLAYVLVAAD